MKTTLLAIAIGAFALTVGPDAGVAAERNARSAERVDGSLQPTKSRYAAKRKMMRVGGYMGQRGGYSYSTHDVVNTYGLSRGLFGSINSYRDNYVDRQTSAGPFDHGFFFDSGMAPRGGDSPYPN